MVFNVGMEQSLSEGGRGRFISDGDSATTYPSTRGLRLQSAPSVASSLSLGNVFKTIMYASRRVPLHTFAISETS